MWLTRLSWSPRKLAPGTRATQGTSSAWSMRAMASLDHSSSREVEGSGVSGTIVGFISVFLPGAPVGAASAASVLGGAARRKTGELADRRQLRLGFREPELHGRVEPELDPVQPLAGELDEPRAGDRAAPGGPRGRDRAPASRGSRTSSAGRRRGRRAPRSARRSLRPAVVRFHFVTSYPSAPRLSRVLTVTGARRGASPSAASV